MKKINVTFLTDFDADTECKGGRQYCFVDEPYKKMQNTVIGNVKFSLNSKQNER